MKHIITKITSRLLAITALAGLFIFSACSDDEGGEVVPTQTIWEIVQEHEDLGSFEAELEAAGLSAQLQAEGSKTLFAPSDAALETLRGNLGGIEDFSDVSEEIVQAVLTYHFANQELLASEITTGTNIATVQGENITVEGGPVLATGATSDAGFDETNLMATNGVVHIVDVVLVPPTVGALIVQTLGTMAQPILLGKDLSILKEGLLKGDEFAAGAGVTTLMSTLIGSEKITMFVPTNATFNAAGLDADSFTGQQWYGIISNHIVVGDGNDEDANEVIEESELTTGAQFETKAGGTLTIFNNTDAIPAQNGIGIYIDSDGNVALDNPETYTNFNAEVAVLNAQTASNGAFHAIAGLLTPEM